MRALHRFVALGLGCIAAQAAAQDVLSTKQVSLALARDIATRGRGARRRRRCQRRARRPYRRGMRAQRGRGGAGAARLRRL